MTISDWIQLMLAIIAGIAAIISVFNVSVTNKQIKQQKKEWEFSYRPVFRVKYVSDFENGPRLIVDTLNNVFHRIEKVSFSNEEVETEVSTYGLITVRNRAQNEKDVYEGTSIKLKLKNVDDVSGIISLYGVDAIGNKFCMKTELIEIKNQKITNKYDLQNSFLINQVE